jgi:inner membrane protein
MEPTTTAPAQQGFFDKNKTIIKGLLIGFLILIMLIPASMVQSLVYERQGRQQQVVEEISSKWATAQTVVGPLLLIPYKYYEKDKDGKVLEYRKNICLLPEQLSVNGKLLPEVRHRSLYDVTLYRSGLSFSGRFNGTAISKLKLDPAQIVWADARLLMGIDDARGLEEEVQFRWNNQSLAMESGVPENAVLSKGLNSPVVFGGEQVAFNIEMKLKGSEQLYFTPVGKVTEVRIASSWKDPAFDGKYLPVTTPEISDAGFTADWKVLQVSRDYPQAWLTGSYDLKESSFGIRLIQPTDSYAKTERSVKYAILFIALTFTVFFFLEILQKRQVHPLQYILVGLSLCVFYTLLLSISEYTGFNPAYTIAATATVMLVGLYVWSIFRKGTIALSFTVALAGLYTYIFILIQLQDYALLFGSIGLFIIIAVLMYASRKIDWYHPGRQPEAEVPTFP